MEKIILGIDPGSHYLGVGCLQKSGNRLVFIAAEAIKAPQKESLYPRLEVIAERLEVLLDLWKPHEVAVEDLFHSINARSAFRLGIARGVAIGACLKRRLPIFEYAPALVKSTVTGSGRADKDQVRKMVELTLRAKIDLRHDATDALAVAICHASHIRLETIVTSARLDLPR